MVPLESLGSHWSPLEALGSDLPGHPYRCHSGKGGGSHIFPNPHMEARLAPRQVLEFTKVRIFSNPRALSSSLCHTPRTTPWHRVRMVGQPMASKSERQDKGSYSCHPRRAEPLAEGTIPGQQRGKEFVEYFFTDGGSEDQREETRLGSHSKAGSRIHCTLSTLSVRLPKGQGQELRERPMSA